MRILYADGFRGDPEITYETVESVLEEPDELILDEELFTAKKDTGNDVIEVMFDKHGGAFIVLEVTST